MKESRLGELLIKLELITTEQLNNALANQRETPDRLLGHVLVDLGYIRYVQLVTTIIEHKDMPLARALLERRAQKRQPVDEYGIPLLRVPAKEAAAMAMPESEFPVPPPQPNPAHFTVSTDTEKELTEDAFTLIKQNNLAEARQIIVQGQAILPDSEALQYLLAWLQSMHGKIESSVLTVERKLPNYRSNASITWLMGYNLQRLGQHPGAAEHYQQLLRHEQPKADCYLGMAYSLDALHHWKKARHVYTHYLRVTTGESKYTWYARKRLLEIIAAHDTD
ncbi:MAG: hypothetical protein WED11_04655 [Natronospirillum sp.]